MYKYFSKLLFISAANNVQLLFVVFIFIFSSCIEALGIGIIGPFIVLASDFSINVQPLGMNGCLPLQKDSQ